MAAFVSSPLDHFNRFQQKDDLKAQFSEDIRHVMHGGYGQGPSTRGDGIVGMSRARAAARNHSPGLAAGAALALGSTSRTSSQDPHSAARGFKERARGHACPFDDHSAFRREGSCGSLGLDAAELARGSRGAGARSMTPSRRPPPMEDAYAAGAAARNLGRQNREQQTRIFSSAPFDAPEVALPTSTYAAAASDSLAACGGGGCGAGGGARSGATPGATPSGACARTLLGRAGGAAPAGAPEQLPCYSDARREAAGHKARMQHGVDGLIAGNYLQGEGRTGAPVGRSGKPPLLAGGELLPQAKMKAQMDGLGRPSEERAAYLNAQVMGEAASLRNNSRLHFC